MATLTPKRPLSERTQNVVREAREFLNTDAGRQQIDSAMRQANEASVKLREASRVDPKVLHQPFTI